MYVCIWDHMILACFACCICSKYQFMILIVYIYVYISVCVCYLGTWKMVSAVKVAFSPCFNKKTSSICTCIGIEHSLETPHGLENF